MRLAIFYILISFSLSLFGQREEKLQVLNIQHGLSQSVVNDVLIDSKGFLWVGTQNGLNRYDGYDFKIFHNNPQDPYSISSDYINAIAEDANDNLWIGTRTGLNKYDSRKQKFIHYGLPSNSIVFPEINVRSLLVDSENFVWVLLPNYLVRINPMDQEVRIFGFSDERSLDRHCTASALYQSSNGNIWFLKGHQLVMFDKVFGRFDFNPIEVPGFVNCFQNIFEHNNQMYITSDQTVWKYKSGDLLQKVQYFDGQISIFQNKKDNEVYLVSNKGLYRIKNGAFQKQLTFDFSSSNIERFFVSALTLDSSENLWIATSGKGILKTNISDPKFEVIEQEVKEGNFLSDDQISSIFFDGLYYWIGTYEYGLNFVNSKTRKVTQMTANDRDAVITNDNIYDIKHVGSRAIVATSLGLNVINRNSKGKLVRESHPVLDKLKVHVYEVLPVKSHSMFFSYGGQLHLYDLEEKELQSWMFDMEKDAGIANSFCLENVEDDLVFIGTSHGLFRFDLRNKYWDRFLYHQDDTTSLSGNDVYALDYDRLGRLWVGTANGLDLLDDPFSNDPHFNHITGDQKSTIYSINNTDKHAFVGTGNGLLRIRYSDSTRTLFHKADGLPCDEFNVGATYEFKNGRLAFGGQGGVAFFHPDSLQLSAFNPEVEISGATIYGSRGKREVPVYSGATLDLSVSDFLVNIYFSSLDLTAPQKIEYRYRVNDSDWISIGNQNYASFSNLQPGKYRISVNGTNADRIWSSNIAYLKIQVPRPWYATWWAYSFYTVLFLGALLFGIETRTRRLRLTNQVLRDKEASAKQVSRQNDRLTILHKNVTESMNYASRIQQALFPANNSFKRVIPHSFVMHRPKDIISGDFYWYTEVGAKICIAAVDCTGHGVPGALMSVIAVELLKKTVVQNGHEKPSDILEKMEYQLYELFITENEEEKNISDGMDMGLCMIDRETMTLEFAGAMNSLYNVKNGVLNEIKGDRVPVGMGRALGKHEYTNHYLEFSDEDIFYMASDGYADQFGGPQNKKYKQRRFRNFLLSIARHDMDMQHLLLENNFDKWRGANEQVDDVMVMGFKTQFE